MKGLIIKKFWLDKIFDENKDWEIRGSNTLIRGKIVLIQSGSGLIMGEAELIDVIPMNADKFEHNKERHQISSYPQLPYTQPYAWVLKNAQRYEQPKPYNHPQGAVIWVNLEDNDG